MKAETSLLAANSPVMTATGLRRSYGDRTVLDVGEIALHRGEILALMGPSGSGKTTLLRLLATLERPSAGEVRFKDATWAASPPAVGPSPGDLLAWRRGLAFVSQNPVLFTGSVRDNVVLGLELRGRAGPGAEAAVTRVLDDLGLGALALTSCRSLSAGEAQRVAVARAFVIRPEVLLLDEPTANLDPANVGIIERALVAAAGGSDWRPAIFLVTHNLFQARRIAGRTGLLVAGRLVEAGPTRDVFERPADPRTKAFVEGEMVF